MSWSKGVRCRLFGLCSHKHVLKLWVFFTDIKAVIFRERGILGDCERSRKVLSWSVAVEGNLVT